MIRPPTPYLSPSPEPEREPEPEPEADALDDESGADPAPSDALELSDGSRRGHLAIKEFDERGRPKVIEHRFVVEAECEGWRLDRFLMKRVRRLSRTRVQ